MDDIKSLPPWAQDLIARYQHDVSAGAEYIANLTGKTPTDVYYGGMYPIGFLPKHSVVTFEITPDSRLECSLRERNGDRYLDVRACGKDGDTISVENVAHTHVLYLRVVSVRTVIAKWEEIIEFKKLRVLIRKMSVRSQLYRLLKEELSARGWWKNRPRGVPGNLQNKL